jgi:hypothetical protein
MLTLYYILSWNKGVREKRVIVDKPLIVAQLIVVSIHGRSVYLSEICSNSIYRLCVVIRVHTSN